MRQRQTETPPGVLLGPGDERLTEALVQAGAAVVSGFSDVPLWITHRQEGSGPSMFDLVGSDVGY